MSTTTHLAIDLGAGSGRVVAGHFDGTRLELEEAHRFGNAGVQCPSGWHWNVTQLFSDIQTGLSRAQSAHGSRLTSLAVDTWGVDYGLVDKSGRLLGLPWMYRDDRTDGMIEEATKILPREDLYARTGIQFMPFNTIFQLLAEKARSPEALAVADQILFMPDLLTYWLSGERVIERTIASTGQLLQPGSADWDLDLIEKMGLPAGIFRPTTDPGVVVGPLRTEIGCGPLQVSTCGSHDTASAVAGVPSATAQPLFLSSGTWSLIGRELQAPLVNPDTLAAGFSNEQGLQGTTRFLKNVAGMWLLQECKRQWDGDGQSLDFATLVREAASAKCPMWLNPDADVFAKPCDMPAAICAYAAKTGQTAPTTPGEFTRVILESLALRYRAIMVQLRSWMPDLPDTLHIVGGGSRNALLNQMTADATGLRVMAGPVEATAAGNILAQLLALGTISSLEQGREILRASFQPEVFVPKSPGQWTEKSERFANLLS